MFRAASSASLLAFLAICGVVVPKLELIYHVPYALIIPVCIGGALIGHIALTRALLRREA